MKTFPFTLIVLVCATLLCSHPALAQGLNFTGTFSGTATTSGGISGPMSLELTQTGSSISGYGSTFYEYLWPVTAVLVAGTVNGTTVTLTLTGNNGGCPIYFTHSVTSASNESITGTYVKSGGCSGNTRYGSFAVTRVPPLTLAGALDTTSLTWTTGGSAGWSGQTSNTHDGVDAAQSGLITDNQESWMQTTVNGPGTLTFWWKVSSDDFSYPPGNYYGDYLEFYANGVLLNGSISGEVNWQQQGWMLAAGTYTLRWSYVKDFADVFGSAQDKGWVDQVLFVASTPTITVQPSSQSITVGANVTFSVTATGTAAPTYRWQVSTDSGNSWSDLANNNLYSGVTTGTVSITGATSALNGYQYRCVATNNSGSASSTAAVLTVIAAPTTFQIVDQPDSRIIAKGHPLNLSVVATSSKPLTYQWKFNGRNILAGTFSTLIIPVAAPRHSGVYSVVISDGTRTITSADANVRVINGVKVHGPNDRTVRQGRNVVLTVTATGTGPLGYQWFFNGNPIAGAISRRFVLNGVQPEHAGTYSVGVANLAGAVESRAAILTVY